MLNTKMSDGPRWPRGQKFTLSAMGVQAEEAYRGAVLEARAVSRSALDAALAAWAAPRQVASGDGVILGELRAKPRGLQDLARALEDAGTSAAEVRASVDRLFKAGLLEPVPLASRAVEPAPPAVPRWR
jgi:hypothetical protein